MEGDYEGSWEDDLRHGKGKQIYRNNDVYDGQWEYNKVRFQGANYRNLGLVNDMTLLELLRSVSYARIAPIPA